jgi:hypothetical protein
MSVAAGEVLPQGAQVDTAGQVTCTDVVICNRQCDLGGCCPGRWYWAKHCRTTNGGTTFVISLTDGGVPETITSIPTPTPMKAYHQQSTDQPGSLPPPGQKYKHFIRTKTASLGDRGTLEVFDISGCPNQPGADFDSLEVDQGEVDIMDPAGTVDVTAGEDGDFCEGCPSYASDGCTWPCPPNSAREGCVVGVGNDPWVLSCTCSCPCAPSSAMGPTPGPDCVTPTNPDGDCFAGSDIAYVLPDGGITYGN